MDNTQLIKWTALRAWLLRHWIPAQSKPELLDGDAMHAMWIPAVILGSVGVAFLLLSVVDYVTRSRAPN